MAQHHVDAADAHARAASEKISALTESSAAATRRVKELEVRVEDLNHQSQWTEVNVDFRLPAALCFTVPPTDVGGAISHRIDPVAHRRDPSFTSYYARERRSGWSILS